MKVDLNNKYFRFLAILTLIIQAYDELTNCSGFSWCSVSKVAIALFMMMIALTIYELNDKK